MKYTQVAVTLLALVGCVVATGYGSGGASYGGGSAGGRPGGPSSQNGPPQPYSFDYNAADEQGNVHYRNEQGDQNGNVKGTYGYNDVQGLYRIVEYVADQNGFRANIKTNEPGVDGKESPADVVLSADQPPAGLASSAGSYGGSYKPSGSAPKSFPPSSGSGKSGY